MVVSSCGSAYIDGAASNKSLNRSGGSVFRIKRDPAKVLDFALPG